MKSDVTGIAGSVRNDHLTLAELANAEKHGKRLDKTGPARAINSLPPSTTTGLDLRALYDCHVRDAFIPQGRSKVIHTILQFPTELVNPDDPFAMLHHARRFAETVFGPDAIFADRLDRDEKSRHVVDLFITPKYVKKTKRQEKMAVSMTRDLKRLQQRYNHPAGPQGNGRALQDAWFEYMRDEMGLTGVQRGQAKVRPGSDWKSAEQLRLDELEEEQDRLDRLKQNLDLKAAEIAKKQAEATARLAEADQQSADLAEARRDAEIQVERARAEAMAAERKERDAQQAALAARAARNEADRATANLRLAELDVEAALQHAAQERAEAAAALLQARQAREQAEQLAQAAAHQNHRLDQERRLQNQQMDLLTKAADERNDLNLRPGKHPRVDVGFVMEESAMTQDEKHAYLLPWSAITRAMGKWLAEFMEKTRALLRSLQERERSLGIREADLAAREAKARQDEENVRLRLAELEARSQRVGQEERAAVEARERALAKEAQAMAALATAEENAKLHNRWQKALELMDKTPEIVVIDASGAASLNPEVARSMGDEFCATFQSPMPSWAQQALGERLLTAEKLHRATVSEQQADALAKTLESMVARLGPVMNESQKAASNEIRSMIQQRGAMGDRGW